MLNINEYKEVRSCFYKGEEYFVRDNGAVLRKAPPQAKKRKTDDTWTFGKKNKNGYFAIASVPVHRIVAFAYLGEAPSKKHVVDHIDTNKCNNRPSNLRWVTRLENVLKNDFTRKKIEYVIGAPIESFLENPKRYQGLDSFHRP